RDNIIDEIFLAGVRELMRLAGSEKERVPRAHFRRPVLVSNTSAAGDDEIQLRLRAVRVIRTIRFTLRNPHHREVKRMPLRQIERLAIAAERDRHILDKLMELSLGGFPLLF